MGYDNSQRGSAGTVVAIVAVVVALLLGGLVLVGVGGLFFLRTEARQVEMVARVEADRAVVEMQRAEKLVVLEQAKGSAKAELREASTRELIIKVEQDGTISIDDERTDLRGLRARIQRVGEDGGVPLAVQLKANPHCLARHVAAVHSVCRELGVADIDISTLEVPSSAVIGDDAATTEAVNLP